MNDRLRDLLERLDEVGPDDRVFEHARTRRVHPTVPLGTGYRRVLAGVTAFAVFALAAGFAWHIFFAEPVQPTDSSAAQPPSWVIRSSQEQAAANGDLSPSSAEWVLIDTKTARAAIDVSSSSELSGASVALGTPTSSQSYLVVLHGRFTFLGAPIPAGEPHPTGTVVSFTLDPQNQTVTDFGIGDLPPAVAGLRGFSLGSASPTPPVRVSPTEAMPELIGTRQDLATRVLAAHHLHARIIPVVNRASAGEVVGQTPAAGRQISTHNEVTLHVSIGPETPALGVVCALSQLALSRGQEVVEATGQNSRVLVLTNTSSAPCHLDGYPSIVLVDASGSAIPFRYHDGGDQMITVRPPRSVNLAPGQAVYFEFNKYRCDTGDLREVRTVKVTPPGTSGFLSINPGRSPLLGYCGSGDPGSVVNISPIEATLRGTSRF